MFSSSGRSGDRVRRVLVADDDDGVCELLKAALGRACEVTAVHDAEAALERVAGEPFDAIIADFMMPGLSGSEFVQRVRGDEERTHVPILVISGHGAVARDRAREAGADAFLDKPFSLAALRATLGELLQAPFPS